MTVSEREYRIARGASVATALTLVMVKRSSGSGNRQRRPRYPGHVFQTPWSARPRALEVALQPGIFPEARAIYDALQAFRESPSMAQSYRRAHQGS